MNLIVNYGQMVLKLFFAVINIAMGVAFVVELMAAKIRNVVSGLTQHPFMMICGSLAR